MDSRTILSRGTKAAAAALAALIASTLTPKVLRDLDERRSQRLALEPFIREARLWPMTYETATPGRPVVWCVDHPAKSVSYLAGAPSQPLAWTNEAELPETNGPTSGGRCRVMVARVAERRPDALVLEYLGSP